MTLAFEVDATFIQGMAALIAAVIVFVGSVTLLLTLVLGFRLAYLISASITLAFLLIMGVVWSGFFAWGNTLPLGPVGELPSYHEEAVGETPEDVDFGPASSYPEGDWTTANPDDAAQAAIASEFEGAAADILEKAIQDKKIESFADPSQATVNSDLTRLLEQDDTTYGGVTFEAAEGAGADPDATAVVFMSRDAGNPYLKARWITLGVFILLILHLVLLAFTERRVRERAETERPAPATTTTTP